MRPMVIAHRGARAIEPENTIRSFVRAGQVGADAIELDLRVTADGRLVVLHDATVDRTTDGTGAIAELSFVDVRRLDAGAGERIPTFEEVLAAVDLPIQAEVKAMAAVAPLAALATGLADRIVVSSFDEGIVAALAEAAPNVPRAVIFADPPADAVARAQAVAAEWLCLGMTGLTEELCDQCRAAGIDIDGWPVGDAETLRRAMALDLAAITTDYAHVVRDWRC